MDDPTPDAKPPEKRHPLQRALGVLGLLLLGAAAAATTWLVFTGGSAD